MSRAAVERRLTELGARLRLAREELVVANEQLAHFEADADDARIRAMVSETPLASQEHREAQRHADAMARHRSELAEEIVRLEAALDDLLDRLVTEST
jgi:hypothetical protein